jgi:sec-independent protein translocase protein TatA
MGLFDSPTHLLIILVVLVVLFGSAKLPKAAKSMGEAMRIFKKESAKMHAEDDPSTAEVHASAPQQVAAAQPQVAPPPQVAPHQVVPEPAAQQQMAALKQQMDALQQQMASAPQPTVVQPAPGTPPSTTLPETQHTNQPG